jgi:hypothetical protein
MKTSRVLLRMSLVLMFCAAGWAQTGSITGTVKDPSGASIAGATVVVTSPDRGITRSMSTNSTGDYNQSALPQGSYDVIVSATGFKKFQAKGVVLDVAQKARVDVTLEVGAISTEVIVQGENVAQVETQSSELAGTVTGKEITQLQLNGRNFTTLVSLVPGVSNQTGMDEPQVGINGSVQFSMNGGRTEYNAWELDGGDNMDNGSNGTLNVYPSVDAIAEFKVLTSNYGAQYGRNGSGTVEVETKGGTKVVSRRRLRIRAQRRLQRAELHRYVLARRIGKDRSVQEERFRLYDWRPGLHSGRVQQGQAEDVFLLVSRVAS